MSAEVQGRVVKGRWWSRGHIYSSLRGHVTAVSEDT